MNKEQIAVICGVSGVTSFVTYLVTAGTMQAKAHMFDILNALFRATS